MEQGIMNQLPCEIIEEILYKLPVKPLLRFKCVSKPWRCLISSKYFIKHHLKKSSNNTDLPNHNQLFLFKYYQTQIVTLKTLSPNKELIDLPSLRNIRNTNYYYCRIVGSCNGLTLVTVYTPSNLLLLWNPSTRQVKRILPPASFTDEAQSRLGQTDLSRWADLQDFVFGFCYNESSDEYKVVCRKDHDRRESRRRTEMYSSKSDSWKKIQDFHKGYPIPGSEKCVNGRFHWLARDWRVRNICIFSLDLFEEKYETLNLEESLHYNDYDCLRRRWRLDELGGYLSLVIVDADLRDVHVWAMMEYGKRESWAKVWTLSDFFDYGDRFLKAQPLCLKKNGDIAVAINSKKNGDIALAIHSDTVVVYNGKNELCRSELNFSYPKTVFYDESLVSPFGTDEQ